MKRSSEGLVSGPAGNGPNFAVKYPFKRRGQAADPDLLLSLGDLDLPDVRLLDEIDQLLQLAQVHRRPPIGRSPNAFTELLVVIRRRSSNTSALAEKETISTKEAEVLPSEHPPPLPQLPSDSSTVT